jgi:polar amino acid transport system permease protein
MMTFAAVGPFQVPWGDYVPDLFQALLNTLKFTVFGFAGASILGFLVALMRVSRVGTLRVVARVYTEILRNMPLITQIFIVYFGLASVGIKFDALTAGSVTLALFYGAYLSEIFRAGLQGVQRGQHEGAQALGLSERAALMYVILPQAIRLALPGTATMLVDLLKGTSLMVTIAGGELMTEASVITSDTFRAMEVYVVIGLVYLALCYPLTHLALMLEQRLHAGLPLSPRRLRLWRMIANMEAELADPATQMRPSQH